MAGYIHCHDDVAGKETTELYLHSMFPHTASLGPCGYVITRSKLGEHVDCMGVMEGLEVISARIPLGAFSQPAAKFVSCAKFVLSSALINIDYWD